LQKGIETNWRGLLCVLQLWNRSLSSNSTK